jgi:hypothetical protein
MKNLIGTNAGKIWNALDERLELSVKELQKTTKLRNSDLYLALGWLSKENKICLFEEKGELVIRLIY